MNIRNYGVVSMPYIGLPPFLHDTQDTKAAEGTCVNALYRASPISTDTGPTIADNSIEGVNALYRASPISTGRKETL